MATNNRSRAAILHGAKIVLAQVGSYQANMNDIASRAEVSRATVYNHFSDKEEMLLALVEAEIDRLSALARERSSRADALYLLSRDISQDLALRRLVTTDPADIVALSRVSDHPLWLRVQSELAIIFGAHSSIVLHWLIGQIASPLSEEESRSQSVQLALAL